MRNVWRSISGLYLIFFLNIAMNYWEGRGPPNRFFIKTFPFHLTYRRGRISNHQRDKGQRRGALSWFSPDSWRSLSYTLEGKGDKHVCSYGATLSPPPIHHWLKNSYHREVIKVTIGSKSPTENAPSYFSKTTLQVTNATTTTTKSISNNCGSNKTFTSKCKQEGSLWTLWNLMNCWEKWMGNKHPEEKKERKKTDLKGLSL